MASVNGQLVTCDRCGASIFLKCTGEGERDGGFTRWNKFEPPPEGWSIVSVPSKDRATGNQQHIRVCPPCHRLWFITLNEHFLRGSELYVIDVKEELTT